MKNLPKILPIFPLSNFIIFPKTTVPLNIFEPRYIDMINDSMKSDKLIGMVQPKKNNQQFYSTYFT
jgi:Lon protease-like protein